MNKYRLEVCVDSVESALAAERGGADRLELCGNLMLGGTTPSPALYREIRKHSQIRIHALIRPRFGDFCYTGHEYQIIRGEIRMFRELGAEGVVIGILHPDGTLHMEQMRMLMEDAAGMSVTLHRAFDVCADPYQCLEQAKELGISTILTSGQKHTCLEGKALLKELIERSGKELEILVGSGVSADVIRELQPYIYANAYHLSGKVTVDSAMEYRKQGVSMGLSFLSEYDIWRTEEARIREARNALDLF